MGTWKRSITAALLIGASATAASAAPAAQTTREARSHFTRGLSFYQGDRLEDAAHEFEEAYRISPRPLFLYNLGHTYVRIGDLARAQEYFQRFLAADPEAPQRSEVEQRIRILGSIVSAQLPRARVAEGEESAAVSSPRDAAATQVEDAELPPFLRPAPPPLVRATVRNPRRMWIGVGVAAGGTLAITAVTLLSILVPRGDKGPPSTLGTYGSGL